MAPRRDFIPYQLPRIASRLTSHNVLHQEQSQGSGTTADGQHFSSNLHKQNGRDTLPHAILPSQKSMGLVPHPQYLGDSAPHPRNTEVEADRESRVFLDSSDWKLHPGVFNHLYQKWGPLNIALFASRLSCQLDQFVSLRPDPLAIHTDAFTMDWATFRGYVFPPFALIGRCLRQIQSQPVSHMVFVAPVWPAQLWYPLLLALCIDFPLLLPVQEDLLT